MSYATLRSALFLVATTVTTTAFSATTQTLTVGNMIEDRLKNKATITFKVLCGCFQEKYIITGVKYICSKYAQCSLMPHSGLRGRETVTISLRQLLGLKNIGKEIVKDSENERIIIEIL